MTGGERLGALAYAAAWSGVAALPHELALRGAYGWADLAFTRRGPRVLQLARNYLRVLRAGDTAAPAALAELTRAGLRSYARYWVETFRLSALDPAEVAARAGRTTTGLEHARAAVDSGRGLIMALPHSGNWDVAGLFLTRALGRPIVSVAEELRPASVYRRFVAHRESLGFEILPLGASVSATLKERLKAGGVVCLLGDRDLTDSGVPVRFFAEPTRFPAGPAMLAALTGADLCPVHLSFTADGWRQVIGAPLTLPGTRLAEQARGGTQLLADAWAAGIAAHPQDWHMLQPLWTADRPGAGRAA